MIPLLREQQEMLPAMLAIKRGSLRVISNCYVEKVLTEFNPSAASGEHDTYSLRAVGVECSVSDYPENDVGPTRMKPIRIR